MGNNAASSAQSKCVGGDKMAHFGDVWGKQGCAGGIGAVDSEWRLSVVVKGTVNDAAGVSDMGGSEMGHCWGF